MMTQVQYDGLREMDIDVMAETVLDEWMHVTGYTDEIVSDLSGDLLKAIQYEVQERNREYFRNGNQGGVNEMDEYMAVIEAEVNKRGMANA